MTEAHLWQCSNVLRSMAFEDEDSSDDEVWTSVARRWYSPASEPAPTTGRLYHHLGTLARMNQPQRLRSMQQNGLLEVERESGPSRRDRLIHLAHSMVTSEAPSAFGELQNLNTRSRTRPGSHEGPNSLRPLFDPLLTSPSTRHRTPRECKFVGRPIHPKSNDYIAAAEAMAPSVTSQAQSGHQPESQEEGLRPRQFPNSGEDLSSSNKSFRCPHCDRYYRRRCELK